VGSEFRRGKVLPERGKSTIQLGGRSHARYRVRTGRRRGVNDLDPGMGTSGMKTSILAATAVAVVSSAAFGQATVSTLPLPDGAFSSTAYQVSPNGRFIVGSVEFAGGSLPCVWDRAGGVTLLPVASGTSRGFATGVSNDGTTVTGTCQSDNGQFARAVRWTSGGETSDLGALDGHPSNFAWGANAACDVVVGQSGNRPTSWTLASGLVGLPVPNGASGAQALYASYQGSACAGLIFRIPFGCMTAFRWTDSGGMQDLGALPGYCESVAAGISGDGQVVIGYCQSGSSTRPFRWSPSTGMTPIGMDFPAPAHLLADSVNEHGSVIFGRGLAAGTPFTWVWSAHSGTRRLDEVLANAGADLSGWELLVPQAASADGSVIAVDGYLNGVYRTMVAEIPQLADTDGDGIPSVFDNCPLVTNPTQADCDADGIGDACDSGGDINGNGIPDNCECIADLFVDGVVNGVDLGVLLAYWGPTTSAAASQRSDLNSDGAVDGIDLGYLLSRWGSCTN
jgi:probable HAF family extracellular repeat protein